MSVTPAAYRLEPLRGLAGLTVGSQERPEPGPRQVLVRVRAASINRRDLMLMEGTYPLPARPGVVPLSDGVGEVVEVGSAVVRAAVGDRVSSTYYLHWVDGPQRRAHVSEQFGANHDGWLATYVLLDEDSVVRMPDHLTDAEAAALTCAGVTAWSALTTPLPVESGETVVVVGSGNVALCAMQLARVLGARVLAVTSSPEKAARIRRLGVDGVIDRTRTPSWDEEVLELTDGNGAERVIDAVGMATMTRSVASGAFNALVNLVGAFPADVPATDPFGGRYLSIRRIAVGSRAQFEAMNRAIAEHRIRPVVDREFGFAEAAAAFDHFRTGDPFGKVVVAG